MSHETKDPSRRPLAQSELVEAIDASGYPLEILLYERLATVGMSPSLGARLPARDAGGEGAGRYASREIDLIARVSGTVPGGHLCTAELVSLIDAKKMHEPTRFVGIVGREHDRREKRSLRSFFWGCPAFPSKEPNSRQYWHAFAGDGGIMEVFDVFEDVPVGVHWAIAKRKEAKPFEARVEGDRGFFESIETLVTVSVHNDRENNAELRSMPVYAEPLPYVGAFAPTLILDTPTLYAYSPRERSLAEVSHLALAMSFECEHKVVRRMVDVVCLPGLDAWIERHREAGALLENWMRKHRTLLFEHAVAQRPRHLV